MGCVEVFQAGIQRRPQREAFAAAAREPGRDKVRAVFGLAEAGMGAHHCSTRHAFFAPPEQQSKLKTGIRRACRASARIEVVEVVPASGVCVVAVVHGGG